MMRFYFPLLCAAALALGGCAPAMQAPSQSVGQLPVDTADSYVPVQSAAQASPPRIVKEYIPIPMPGQKMALAQASHAGTASMPSTPPVFLSKEAAVKYANQQALLTPQSQDFFNAIMTYQYMPGALYTIYTAPMKITDIAFANQEKVISVAAGDTLRWQISQTYSGEGATLQQHLLVKPNAPGLNNTLVVTTSQRVYHLVLISTTDGTYMAAVSWQYPGSMVQFSDAQSTPADTSSSSTPVIPDVADLDFAYRFGVAKGAKPAWYPERVFNDGRQTFIVFPKRLLTNNVPLPMLFVADNNDQYGTMYNWRQKGRYMIIDAVIHNARLQSGVGKDSTVVQIEYTGSNP